MDCHKRCFAAIKQNATLKRRFDRIPVQLFAAENKRRWSHKFVTHRLRKKTSLKEVLDDLWRRRDQSVLKYKRALETEKKAKAERDRIRMLLATASDA